MAEIHFLSRRRLLQKYCSALDSVYLPLHSSAAPSSSPSYAAFIFTSYYLLAPAISKQTMGYALMSRIFIASDFLLLSTNPQGEFIQNGSPKATEMSIWKKFNWAIQLALLNPRGIGWNISVMPRNSPKPSRWTYVREQLIGAAGYYLLVDAAQTYHRTSPDYARIAQTPNVSIGSQGYTLRCAAVASWGAALFGLEYANTLAYAAIVAVGIAKPEDWPPKNGSLRHAYTIRGFWGYVY